MVFFSDDIYTGGTSGGPDAFAIKSAASQDTTLQGGCGPLGRIAYRTATPQAISNNCLAALQASVANTPLKLQTGGSGITTAVAPDASTSGGPYNPVYVLDTPRAVSLTSASNLSAINYLITGYDEYNIKLTQLVTGPNNSTVNTKKTFHSVLSIVPQSASASTISVGVADIFGLPFVVIDASAILAAKFGTGLAHNAGTFVGADQTNPATNLTGDVRGTFAQAGAASNGVLRLCIGFHLAGNQCGQAATKQNAIGVTQA